MTNQRIIGRISRQQRVRKKVRGTDTRPRVCDDRNVTLATVSTLSEQLADKVKTGKGVELAKRVGLALAKVCKDKNINRVVFDRNGFLFHGRVKAVADGAREGGLEF